jgi:hypothetical protein
MKYFQNLSRIWMGERLVGWIVLLFIFGLAFLTATPASSQDLPALMNTPYYVPLMANGMALGNYVLLGWNDLGMHCYNRDFSDLAVLPPYNTLWAQVIKRGNPPQIITSGVRVQYGFPDNTSSVTKSNFWTYAPQLFGAHLPDNVGLTGKGLAGVMDVKSGYFVAEGIPITEFSDSDLNTPQPYQLAVLTAKSTTNGATLAKLNVVAPVSTEMRCDGCHAQGKDPGGPYVKVEQNILRLHDEEEGTNLYNSRPVLCAKCHESNALNMHPNNNLPSLANAMHDKHDGEVANTLEGCYSCHPGPSTKCLRDVMSLNVKSTRSPNHNMDCIDCHGTLSQVKQNPNPWLNEPRCDSCHQATTTKQYNQDQALYRFSKGHGGVYCEACHDSTHAIAPSREDYDAIKFNQLQGHDGPINECLVCHTVKPTGKGPHQK